MIKSIIFDCFGVLVGSGFNETYRLAGGDVTADNDFIRQTLRDASTGAITVQALNEQVSKQIGITEQQWRQAVEKAEQPNLSLLEYIRELKKQYKTAILSNASQGVMHRKFTPEQLALFDEIIVSAEVGMIKPDYEIYVLAAERLGVQPQECVFIDDSQSHCEGAQAAGMQAIWYQNFAQFQKDLSKFV